MGRKKRIATEVQGPDKIVGLKTTPVRRAGPPQGENEERPQDTQWKAYEEPQPVLSVSK
jgi:hypothetical protein